MTRDFRVLLDGKALTTRMSPRLESLQLIDVHGFVVDTLDLTLTRYG